MKREKCYDAKAKELVHKGYRKTSKTWEEKQGTAVITWRKWKCQCGAKMLDVRDKVR